MRNSLPCQLRIAVGEMSYSADMVDAVDEFTDLASPIFKKFQDTSIVW